jgi:hypothetical protein
MGLKEINKLSDKSLEVGRSVGKLEADIDALGWIKPLLSLFKGEGKVEPQQFKNTALITLKSLSSWLKDQYVGGDYWLESHIQSTIGRLEEWKPE